MIVDLSVDCKCFRIAVGFVAVHDHAFTRFKSFEYLVVLRILTSEAYVASVGFLAVFIDHIDPLAACLREERAAWDDDRFGGLSELKVHVVGLSGADVVGVFSGENKLHPEFIFADFGVYFPHSQTVELSGTLEGGVQSGHHTVDIVLIDRAFHLIVAEVVDLADFLPGCAVLSEFDIEKTGLSIDCAYHIEVLFAVADEHHIALHICQIVFHLVDLRHAEYTVLA